MGLETWLAFVAASAVLLVVPGPTVMVVVGYALAEGRRSAWHTVSGLALGDLTAMTVSLAGLGAIISTSAAAFAILKWVGAAYLVYLGLRMWRAGGAEAAATPARGGSMFRRAYVVTALNPKSIAFFVAFLPQFVVAGAPVLPQLLLLGVTFIVLAVLSGSTYAILVGTARETLLRADRLRWANRFGGTLLIGAAIATAGLRRV